MKSQPSHSTDDSDPASGSTEITSSLRRVTMTTRTGQIRPDAGQPGVDPYIGATIDGRYDVESLIGEGGMGVVYRCTHTIIGKKVAMKVLRADMARSEEVVGRFLNEARSASSIGNPHIIDISDFGRLPDGATYFIMEYLEGTSLSGAAERGPPPLDRIGSIAIQLAEALGAAHEVGIVHRDLKPENIFLVRRGSQPDFVKVLDFGIAKVSSASGRFTQAGQVFGTPHYMSPEQAAGANVDHRADIYAVGVILYELVTGRLPFDADTFMGILSQHMYKEPEPPSTLIQFQRLDPDLERVILCCLKKNPDDRYQRMSELESDLRQIFVEPVVSSRELRATALSGMTAHVDRPRGKRWLVGGLLLGLACIGAACAWYFQQGELPGALKGPLAGESKPQKPAPVPPPAPAAPVPTFVAVAVEPLAAHVFRGEQDLGSSPVMIEHTGAPLQLVARASGYTPQTFLVDGSVTKISVKLEPLPKAAPGRPQPKAPPRPAAKSTAPTSKKPSESSGELVNPWD